MSFGAKSKNLTFFPAARKLIILTSGIDIILDGELVVARPIGAAVVEPQMTPVKSESVAPDDTEPPIESSLEDAELEHFRFTIISAELSRSHARQHPKDQSAPQTGVPAFDDEFASGNMTLVGYQHHCLPPDIDSSTQGTLQREAARCLGWELDDAMDIDGDACTHEKEAACSCAVAQEIERHGLFSTLHCRLSQDGVNCGNDECPYSHVELNSLLCL